MAAILRTLRGLVAQYKHTLPAQTFTDFVLERMANEVNYTDGVFRTNDGKVVMFVHRPDSRYRRSDQMFIYKNSPELPVEKTCAKAIICYVVVEPNDALPDSVSWCGLRRIFGFTAANDILLDGVEDEPLALNIKTQS